MPSGTEPVGVTDQPLLLEAGCSEDRCTGCCDDRAGGGCAGWIGGGVGMACKGRRALSVTL